MADILASIPAAPEPKKQKLTAPVAGLPGDLVGRMREDTLAWQAVGGVLIGAETSITPAPCSLLPYPWPAALFAQAQALAVPFNLLVDRVARDTEWLHEATRKVTASDPFTGRLLQLSEKVHAEGVAQPWQLGIYRSDYMIHQPAQDAPRLMQVELNTIAASFGSLSRKISQMHSELTSRWTAPGVCGPDAATLSAWLPALGGAIEGHAATREGALPLNGCEEGVAGALAKAHAKYVAVAKANAGTTLPAVVLMVVQPVRPPRPDRNMGCHIAWLGYVHNHIGNVDDRCRHAPKNQSEYQNFESDAYRY